MDKMLTAGSTNQFIDSLQYSGGFTFEDVTRQSSTGVYINEQSVKEDQRDRYEGRLSVNAAMPVGSGTQLDKTILQAVTAKPTIYNDLTAAGCVVRYDFGTYLSSYSKSNLPENPVTAMDLSNEGGQYSNASQSQTDYKQTVVPIPVQFYNWFLSRRQLAAASNTSSMMGGFNMETMETRNRTIGLQDARERLIWNGNSRIVINDQPLYGILTDPTVVSRALPITFSESSPASFISAVLQQGIQPLLNQNYDASNIALYYSQNLAFMFNQDYSFVPGFTTETVANRIKAISGISKVQGTVYLNNTSDPYSTTTGRMVFIIMQPDVIDLAVESEIQIAQYANDPTGVRYCQFSACAPRIKSDYSGKVGIQLANITITA